jgi:hypothetical protein
MPRLRTEQGISLPIQKAQLRQMRNSGELMFSLAATVATRGALCCRWDAIF